MTILDWILVAIRWGHALAAVAWIGGAVFYLLVLRPNQRQASVSGAVQQAIGNDFRGLVTTAIAVLLLTGAVLSASRLSSDAVGVRYVIVLAVKVALALYMFYVVRFLQPRSYPEPPVSGRGWLPRLRGRLTSATAVLIAGVLVIGLSDLLDLLFEKGLAH